MKTLSAAFALALALGTVAYAPVAEAANARHPHSNVNKANDNGGPTGDSQVEKLNQQQLDQARAAQGYVVDTPQPVGAPAYQPGMTR